MGTSLHSTISRVTTNSDQVTNLANASSLIYNSLLAFPSHFGRHQNAVNWCGQFSKQKHRSRAKIDFELGFYLDSHLFPGHQTRQDGTKKLLLGPFSGKPACQSINIAPKPRGVCADAFIQKRTLVVPQVELYPGHIACDGETKSEMVVPLTLQKENNVEQVLGVLDLDCLAISGFNEDDKAGVENVARLIVNACDW